ncbi:MAG: DUF86 domain-containing protein [Candidatus Moranbacteria bacterium]|jgi:uncharacterized protein with HEPN domain|nr:DUF86 domain-containing protein [Candidatus Moranbacteria bacterium]
MKDNIVYLKHILEAIEKIEKYIKHADDFEDFFKKDMVSDAIIRELEVIGEASNNISKEFQIKNPGIPWRQMNGIRNILIHEYFGVNKKVVWETCQHDLEPLKKAVIALLKK